MKSAHKIAEDAADEAEKPYIEEHPRPLMRELPPADPFPIDALDEILGNAAKGIQQIIQVPIAISCQSVLATATLAVQGHADIKLPTGQQKPLSGFFFTIASSGDRKTASDDEAMQPVHAYEHELFDQCRIDQPLYKNKLEIWEKQRAKILNDKKASAASKEADLEALGTEP